VLGLRVATSEVIILGVLGSKFWFQYTTDSGHNYVCYLRLVDANAANFTLSSRGAFPVLPSFIKKRHVWAVNTANSKDRRKFWYPTTGGGYVTAGNISADGASYLKTGRVGERDFGGVTE
jgi:hypothetical protein